METYVKLYISLFMNINIFFMGKGYSVVIVIISNTYSHMLRIVYSTNIVSNIVIHIYLALSNYV